jgi:hypothetical protein
MAIVYQRLQSLSEIDLDTMFFNSLTALDTNFFEIVPNDLPFEYKKKYYIDQLQSAIAGTWPIREAYIV